jgi:NitT/TauT family transport system substrate-binding protein
MYPNNDLDTQNETSGRGDGGLVQPQTLMFTSARMAAVFLVLALGPSSFAAAQPAPVTIRVGAPVTETSTPLVYAMRAGLFERAGIRIELSKLASGAAVSAAVASGALDAGNTSLLALIQGHARGIPFAIIAAAGNLWGPGSEGGLLVQDPALREPKDFAGKTITAAAVNDINALAMQAWLDRGGADPKSVKFIEIPQPAAPAALEAGRVDGVTLLGAAYATALASPKVRAVGNIFGAIAPRFTITAWFSTRTWVDRNRAAAGRFARVMSEAAAYTNAHPEETLGDLVGFTGMDRAVAAKMKRANFTTVLNPAEVQPVIDVAARYKAIDQGFPASELIVDVAKDAR